MPTKNAWLAILCVISFAAYLGFSRGLGNFVAELGTAIHKVANLRRSG